MKIREVFTITRESDTTDLAPAREEAAMVADEPGEYLYGGGGPEKLEVRFEIQHTPGGPWTRFDPFDT